MWKASCKLYRFIYRFTVLQITWHTLWINGYFSMFTCVAGGPQRSHGDTEMCILLLYLLTVYMLWNWNLMLVPSKTADIQNKYINLWSQTRNKESVVCITCRMLLRLEQRVKVPETTFNKVVCGHFSETVQSNTSEISTKTKH